MMPLGRLGQWIQMNQGRDRKVFLWSMSIAAVVVFDLVIVLVTERDRKL